MKGCHHCAGGRVLLAALLLAGLGLLPLEGRAQEQTLDQQKCTTAMNKGMQKVALAAGKNAQDCVKNFAKNRTDKLGPGGTARDCLGADVRGKVAKARGKTDGDFLKRCTGDDKEGTPRIPPYGVTDPNTVNDAGEKKELDLVHDLFGSDLDTALVLESTDKNTSKCQQAVLKSVMKCQDRRLREFNKCKKDGLSGKLGTPFQSADDLRSCMDADPKGKIAKACDDPGRPDKIRKDIDKRCVARGVDLPEAFPGCATPDPEELHACLVGAAQCRVCLALQEADDFWPYPPCAGCDFIPEVPIGSHRSAFIAVSFCAGGDRDGEPCTDTVRHTDCPGPLNPKPRCISDSTALLNTTLSQPQLTLPLVGNMKLNCDPDTPPDPVTGKVTCDCEVLDLEGQDIRPIGFVCFKTGNLCWDGEMDCDGGNALDLEHVAKHALNFCGLGDDPNTLFTVPGTGNAECEADCNNYCANLGPGFVNIDSGCEGYCQGGPRADMGCNADRECPQSSCGGGDASGGRPSHVNKCFCSCNRNTGNPARPGALSCPIGVQINIEDDLPCSFEDGIDDVSIFLPETCVPLTTETSNAVLLNADNLAKDLPGEERIGTPTSCEAVAAGTVEGIRLAGNVVFWDSTLGDLQTPVILSLQQPESAIDPCVDLGGDTDGDGVCDNTDNCVNDPNPLQRDFDGDGIGDACDTCTSDPLNDADGDGICGNLDNCPDIANPGQEDTDGDGLGDACDACPADPLNDADGDGICGNLDLCPSFAQTDTGQTDTDGDGIPDECQCGDAHEDGLLDGTDVLESQNCFMGLSTSCDPEIADTNGDGVLDGQDVLGIQNVVMGLQDRCALTCARSGSPDTRPACVGP